MTTFALQSVIIYFILLYGYFSPSARNDGYDVAQFEFSTTMVISAAIASNLFNGLNTKFWTGWVFFSVFIGIILIFAYTVRPCLFSSTSVAVAQTCGSRPSTQSSPLDGFLPLSMGTIISCLNRLSFGSVSLLHSYSHSCRGICTWRGLSASTLMTWISSIGTTNSGRTWTSFMKPT